MFGTIVYMTSVGVDLERDREWNEFYDEWVEVFTNQVPGTHRGSRWRVLHGLVGANERVPQPERPMYLAFEEYGRVDEFILSRSWRQRKNWEPRVRSFDPWLRHLHDYATLNLERIGGSRGVAADTKPPSWLLCRIWTIEPDSLEEFERWKTSEVEPLIAEKLRVASWDRYVALLAQLHRYGGPSGELVIPQRHHIEDGGRLCYVDLYGLSRAPTQESDLLAVISTATDTTWGGVVSDMQDVVAERLLSIERGEEAVRS